MSQALNSDQAAGPLHRICPGFIAVGPPITTGTSQLQHGTVDGRAVIAKHPTDLRPWWQDRCRQEITVYRALADNPPPITVPELVAADVDAPLLILTRVPGGPLHPDRYPPAGTVSADAVTRLLHTLDRLHQWPLGRQRGLFPDDSDYQQQINALPDDLLTTDAKDRLIRLFGIAGIGLQLTHGDAHLGNAINTSAGTETCTEIGTALIDLELTAVRPRGYDEAQLFTFLADNPTARDLVSLIPGGRDLQAGFWLAVVLVTCREIVSHRRHANLPCREHRLARLRADLALATDRCHALTNTP
ncbi:aminoglycoside phosphotransferase family protein [Dactylosporangium sp. NPDC051485]|uniref:aminoglycoside phosphotransferase family protein n=1 Tax=Dactylosporangium sp. NPDC051485 TaxID=3154846 RepID=UPI00341C9C48